MSSILISASDEVYEIVCTTLRARMPSFHLHRAESVSSLLQQTMEVCPRIVVLGKLDECVQIDGIIEDLRSLCPQVGIVLVNDDFAPWYSNHHAKSLLACCTVSDLNEDRILTAIRTALRAKESTVSTTDTIEPYNLHRVRNKIASLVIGIRAFGADLEASAGCAEQVNQVIEEYSVRFGSILAELRSSLPPGTTSR